jgi:hypothetical protein
LVPRTDDLGGRDNFKTPASIASSRSAGSTETPWGLALTQLPGVSDE